MPRYSADDLSLDVLETLHELPKGLLGAVMHQESRGNPKALSPKGAAGLFQFMPATAKQYGINPWNAEESANAAARMYRELLDKYGNDLPKALAAYNWGQGRVDKYGLKKVPRETQNYIKNILGKLPEQQAQQAEDNDDALINELFPKQTASAQPSKDIDSDSDEALLATLFPKGAEAVNDDEDALITAAGFDPVSIKKSRFYKPGAIKGLKSDPNSFFRKHLADTPVAGFEQAIEDPILGLNKLAAHAGAAIGVLAPEDAQYADLIKKVREQDYQEGRTDLEPDEFDASRLAGNVVTSLAVPGAALSTPLKVGVVGAATSPQGEGDDYWTEKAKEVALGTGLGTAFRLGAEGLVKGGTKIANALKGTMTTPAQEVSSLAAREGVRMTYGDVSQRPFAQKLETNVLEGLPKVAGGLTSFRAAQQSEIKGAANRLLNQTREQLAAQPIQGIEEIAKVAQSQGPRAAAAQRVLTDLGDSGDDWNRILKTSGGAKLLRSKLQADKLYDAVDDLAQDVAIAPKETQTALTTLLKDAQTDIIDKNSARVLGKYKDALGQGDLSFEQLRRMRSELGGLIADSKRGTNALVGSQLNRRLTQLQDALEKDMEGSITASGKPELIKAWKKADSFYKREVVPYKAKAIARAFSDESFPDEIYNAFIREGKGERARSFFNALEPKGQAAVRSGMIERAYEDAINPATGLFSPAKFAGELESIQKARDVFFKGEEKWKLDGLLKLMRHVERAGQYTENPPTGARLIQNILVSGGTALTAINPASAAAGGAMTVAGGRLMRWMMTSPQGKRFLLASSELPPGSPRLESLITKLEKDMPRALSIGITRNALPDQGE